MDLKLHDIDAAKSAATLSDWRDASWIMEEYKLLNLHYFHEDDFFLKCASHYTSVNTAIITIYGSKAWFQLDSVIVKIIPIIGFVATITWILTLLRVRFVKLGAERRIYEIEESLNKIWGDLSEGPSMDLLRIRYGRKKGGGLNRISSTFIMTLLPAVFSVIWLYLIALHWGDYFISFNL